MNSWLVQFICQNLHNNLTKDIMIPYLYLPVKLKPRKKQINVVSLPYFVSGFTSPRTSWISHHSADLRFLCLLLLLKKTTFSLATCLNQKMRHKLKVGESTDADATSSWIQSFRRWVEHLIWKTLNIYSQIGSFPKSFWDQTWLVCWETGNHHRVMWKWHFMARGPPDWRIRVCLNIWGPV